MCGRVKTLVEQTEAKEGKGEGEEGPAPVAGAEMDHVEA